jgi:hypothetical protein
MKHWNEHRLVILQKKLEVGEKGKDNSLTGWYNIPYIAIKSEVYGERIKLKIYWKNLTVLYDLTCC